MIPMTQQTENYNETVLIPILQNKVNDLVTQGIVLEARLEIAKKEKEFTEKLVQLRLLYRSQSYERFTRKYEKIFASKQKMNSMKSFCALIFVEFAHKIRVNCFE